MGKDKETLRKYEALYEQFSNEIAASAHRPSPSYQEIAERQLEDLKKFFEDEFLASPVHYKEPPKEPTGPPTGFVELFNVLRITYTDLQKFYPITSAEFDAYYKNEELAPKQLVTLLRLIFDIGTDCECPVFISDLLEDK